MKVKMKIGMGTMVITMVMWRKVRMAGVDGGSAIDISIGIVIIIGCVGLRCVWVVLVVLLLRSWLRLLWLWWANPLGPSAT